MAPRTITDEAELRAIIGGDPAEIVVSKMTLKAFAAV